MIRPAALIGGIVVILAVATTSCTSPAPAPAPTPEPPAEQPSGMQLADWVDEVSCQFFSFPYRAYGKNLSQSQFLVDVADVERTLAKGARDRDEILRSTPPPIPSAQQDLFVQRLSTALSDIASDSESRAVAADSALAELRTSGAVSSASIARLQAEGGPRFEQVQAVYRDHPDIQTAVRQKC